MHTRSRSLPATVRYGVRSCWLVVPLLATVLAGCQEYHWRSEFDGLEAQAREQNKDCFIFYKFWLDRDSNDMLAVELSDPQVKALFQNTINVLLEQANGPMYEKYMERFGVTSYPASVVVRPDGKFKVLYGRVPKERFIEWAAQAKSPPPQAGKKPPTSAAGDS